MPKFVSIQMTGVNKLFRKLNRFEPKRVRALTRKALRAEGSVILKAVRRAAPRGPTGNLRRSMRRRVRSYGGSGILINVIGPAWPLGAHGHLVEFGTAERGWKTRTKQYTGKMPASHFFEKAIRRSQSAANAAFNRKMAAEIEKEALKGGR